LHDFHLGSWIQGLADGTVDVVIGTHAIASARFHKLAMVVRCAPALRDASAASASICRVWPIAAFFGIATPARSVSHRYAGVQSQLQRKLNLLSVNRQEGLPTALDCRVTP
jgi:hypothetical protein